MRLALLLLILSGALALPSLALDLPKIENSQDLTIWPNRASHANSDPWIVANHDRIRQMRPRVLVLNFCNRLDPAATADIAERFAWVQSASTRYHGYSNPEVPAFLDYQVLATLDLRDAPVPEGREVRNSATWPRDDKEKCRVDYGKLFSDDYTELYDIRDPEDPNRCLSLAEMVDRGIIHELWFIGSHNDEDAAYECVEVKQAYDDQLRPIPDEFRQAGNGGDPRQPWIGRSFRITWINPDRGIGCALENVCHAMEGMAHCEAIPYYRHYFYEFAGFDLDTRYGLPFNSFYACSYAAVEAPITWTGPRSIEIKTAENGTTVVGNYVPVAGNVHFTPNGRCHYDLQNPDPVDSTIESYRLRNGPDGNDLVSSWSPATYRLYSQDAPDCMGAWLCYWRQNMPGLDNPCVDDAGNLMKNWWVFLFY